MTKATGRGRGWRKKQWSQLAPSTQKRYLRMGIDAPRHAQGYSATWLEQFAKDQERFYGMDADEVKAELADYPRSQVMDAIKNQRDMQDAYNRGNVERAHQLWEGRDQDLPEWMNKYHSYFS